MSEREMVCLLGYDPPLERLLLVVLKEEDLEVKVCQSSKDVAEACGDQNPVVALVNIGTALEPALSIIRDLKQLPTTAVLATSASGPDASLACIEAGSDDYLAMPFDPELLLDHVRFLLGRPTAVANDNRLFGAGPVKIDMRHRALFVNDSPVRISRPEWDILRVLLQNAGQPVFFADMARAAFGREMARDTTHLQLWMRRLQASMGCDPERPTVLRPFHNIAYTLDVTELAPGPG